MFPANFDKKGIVTERTLKTFMANLIFLLKNIELLYLSILIFDINVHFMEICSKQTPFFVMKNSIEIYKEINNLMINI